MKAFLPKWGNIHLFIYSYILQPHVLTLEMSKTELDSIDISIVFTNEQHGIFKAEEGFYGFKTCINIQATFVSDIARKFMVLDVPKYIRL